MCVLLFRLDALFLLMINVFVCFLFSSGCLATSAWNRTKIWTLRWFVVLYIRNCVDFYSWTLSYLYISRKAQSTVPIWTSENRTPYDSKVQHDFAVAALPALVIDLKGVGGLFQ